MRWVDILRGKLPPVRWLASFSCSILAMNRSHCLACLIVLLFFNAPPANAQLVDAIRNLFRDPIEHAINEGLKPGGDLVREIDDLGYDYEITTEAQANAILRAVRRLPKNPDPDAYESAESAVIGLFESASEYSLAFDVLQQRGIPLLLELHKELLLEHQDPKLEIDRTEELLRILQVASMYMSKDGMELVLKTAHSGFGDEHYIWNGVFAQYDASHPYSEEFYDQMREKLPPREIAVRLLDSINQRGLDGEDFEHPFDSAQGIAALKEWLEDRESEGYQAAYSAAITLAFTNQNSRDALLGTAFEHPERSVKLEAAWAAAYCGDQRGVELLQKLCLDVHSSSLAQTYLEEVDLENKIPKEVAEPKFAAMAEFSGWLQHPNELGEVPDDVTVVDQRELTWFDSDEPRLFTVVSYRNKGESPLDEDDIGVGLVGSQTWCFFYTEIEQLPVEDVYAIHYTWEALNMGELAELDSIDNEIQAKLKAQWQGDALDKLAVIVAYQTNGLDYPESLVGCGKAELGGKPGWVVFDGVRSRWYSKAELPDVSTDLVLQMHLGRVKLGFPLDTKRVLKQPPERNLDSEFIIVEYEKLLVELAAATDFEKSELLSGWGSLAKHFESYVEAKSKVSGQAAKLVLADNFEKFFDEAISLDDVHAEGALESHSIFGEFLPKYAEQVGQDRPAKLKEIIAKLETFWTYPYQQLKLCSVELKMGLNAEAEKRLLKMVEEDQEMHASEMPRMLAEIWHQKGESAKAVSYLLEAIKECKAEIQEYPEDPEYQQDIRDEIKLHRDKIQEISAS